MEINNEVCVPVFCFPTYIHTYFLQLVSSSQTSVIHWEEKPFFPLSLCVMGWMFLSSPNSWCDGVWRWSLWEVIWLRWDHEHGVPLMGFVSSKEGKEKPEPSLSLHRVRTQWEGSHLKARRRTLTRNWISWPWNSLDFPASRTMRNFFCSSQSSLWYFVMTATAKIICGCSLH